MQPMSIDTRMAYPSPVSQWAVGLCGCCTADAAICWRSSFCPCVQYGLNVDRLHPGSYHTACSQYCCLLLCFVAMAPTGNLCFCCDHLHGKSRRELKKRYNIPPRQRCECCVNCLTVSCCPCCSIAQEALQLQLIDLPPAPEHQQMK